MTDAAAMAGHAHDTTGPADGGAGRVPSSRSGRLIRRAGLAAAVVAAASSPWWLRPALSHLDFFRVRRVEIHGVRYASPGEIVTRMGVDSTSSVWDDAGPLESRVRRLPAVHEVRIGRKLPGTLVVDVVENPPVAFVQSGDQLAAVDARGRTLRVDPAATGVDLPVVRTRDSVVLGLLGAVRVSLPAVFARIGDVAREPHGGLVIRMVEPRGRIILASAAVTVDRLFDVIPVEADLARRGVGPAEIDLRFKDQVVARLP
ncbi:MAG: FtsQ-type POTRA domain-containing protein [Gemmatimonadaceae bacterium]|nr:FtsQ-type POTRA domain-containing protein [Gemmatimonadaceae bacterium]